MDPVMETLIATSLDSYMTKLCEIAECDRVEIYAVLDALRVADMQVETPKRMH
jgi:hypothetical protein